jgi:hypothetical protein
MKKTLLFVFAALMSLTTIEAQDVVFEDDFESYENGYSLGLAGYDLWSGSATVTDVDIEGGDAFSGKNFAQCEPDDNNFYFRKNLTLEEGKTYTFEVMTKSPDGKNHRAVVKVGDRDIQGDLVNATDWIKTSVTFTVGAGETDAVMWVYGWPISRIDVDDFKVLDESATAISNVKAGAVQVAKTASGEFMISAENNLSSLSAYTLGGQLIKQMNRLNTSEITFNLNGQSQGLYLLRIEDVKGIITMRKVIHY